MLLRYANLLVILFAVQGWCKPSKNVDGDYSDDTPLEDYADEYSSTGDDVYDPQKPPQIISTGQVWEVKYGDTVTLPCVVKNTEHNVVVWKKDNEFLYSDSNVMTQDGDRIVRLPNNSLVIHDVNRNDSARYECSILTSDPIAIVHTLIVNESSVISVTPGETVRVKLGQSVTLGCHTNLEPPFTMKWFRKSQRLENDEKTANGTYITIHATDRHRGGIYQCLADDRKPTPPHAAINVIVDHSPEVEVKEKMVHTGIGNRVAEMFCTIHAHPHPRVRWYKDEKEILPEKNKIKTKNYKSIHGLTIFHVTQQDLGQYTCVGSNELGEDNKTITLTATPTQPLLSGVNIVKYDKGITLKWHVFSFTPITEYKLQYRKKGEEQWIIVQPRIIQGVENNFASDYFIQDLEPEVSYEAKVEAKNSFGWSLPSDIHVFNSVTEYPEHLLTRVSPFEPVSAAVVARPLETAMTVLLVLSPYIFASS